MHPGNRPERLDGPRFSAVAIIPARYRSTRLPGKTLADLHGRPLIEHVYRRVAAVGHLAAVIVATDDERIRRAVERFGGQVVMTSPTHPSGTDRLAEVAAHRTEDLIVNVQGDEPFIEPAMIREALAAFDHDETLDMSTLRRRIDDIGDVTNPNVTKVVTDRDGMALYFSRAPIPYVRDRSSAAGAEHYKHIGLYVYRRPFLLTLAGLSPTPLERTESLEQLRALEHGYRIKVVDTAYDSLGVDTEEDLQRARVLLEDELAQEQHHAQ